jgi:pyridinium-3,5-bisthiocarboxylic acid mononucleotide nickel chelatase
VILYLDCLRGINAVSALAAAIDTGVDPSILAERLRFLPGEVGVDSAETTIDGFRVRSLEVTAPDLTDRRTFADVVELVDAADLPEGARSIVLGVYERLASAEARVHGSTIEGVTFHEVGRPRSVVAVLGLAIALEVLGVRSVTASPVPVGAGMVETAHGRLPVPTPATIELLREVPVQESAISGELVTPTGAAIVAELATSFGPVPSMTVERIGYGADGHRTPALTTRVVVGSPPVSRPST